MPRYVFTAHLVRHRTESGTSIAESDIFQRYRGSHSSWDFKNFVHNFSSEMPLEVCLLLMTRHGEAPGDSEEFATKFSHT